MELGQHGAPWGRRGCAREGRQGRGLETDRPGTGPATGPGTGPWAPLSVRWELPGSFTQGRDII